MGKKGNTEVTLSDLEMDTRTCIRHIYISMIYVSSCYCARTGAQASRCMGHVVSSCLLLNRDSIL